MLEISCARRLPLIFARYLVRRCLNRWRDDQPVAFPLQDHLARGKCLFRRNFEKLAVRILLEFDMKNCFALFSHASCQFSTRSPGTRSNSRVLQVTTIKRRASAIPAMSRS